MMELLWLLLPVAAAFGWYAAKRSNKRMEASAKDQTPAYFRGLNYLLNEQPDKAIDVFVQMLEVDSETVETHLALGNLFRRRGEVDRAIRIHQNLIARPTLNRDQRAQALLELGQDYMRAGLFDRAESLFGELGEMNLYQEQALASLLIIYQQEKEWKNCLKVVRKLEKLTGKSQRIERAHFYCELAEEAKSSNDQREVTALLKKAQGSDSECVRASILQGEIEAANGAYKMAINAFKSVEWQDPAYVNEIMLPLVECYLQQDKRKELIVYLRQLFKRHQSIEPALTLSRFIQEDEGEEAAAGFITEYLNQQPNLEGLDRLIALRLGSVKDKASDTLPILQQLVRKLLQGRPIYRCSRCGFTAKTLHWQCPGCKSWSSIRPNTSLDNSRN